MVDAQQQQHPTFQYGDILAGGDNQLVSFARFDWYLPDGTLNKRMWDTAFGGLPADVAFDAAGNVYLATGKTVRVFDNTGTYLKEFPQSPARAFEIVFDRAGNVYLAAETTVLKTTPAGDMVAAFVFPVENAPIGQITAIDLAADQCTMYYTTSSAPSVLRYDVCRGVPLSDFASSLPRSPSDMRILPDGGVLVSIFEVFIVRLDSTGSVVQTYDHPLIHQWYKLALNVDGRSFWATLDGLAFKFDLATGAILGLFQSSDYIFSAIAVVGEPRAAPTPPISDIPALSEWFLFALLLSLVGVAVARLR